MSTGVIEKAATAPKGMLEIKEKYTYSVEFNHKVYFYFLYKNIITRKGTGAFVIEENGEMPDRQTAIAVAFRPEIINSIIRFARTGLTENIQRSPGFLIKTSDAIKPVVERSSDPKVQEAFKNFEHMSVYLNDNKERLIEIHQTIKLAYDEVLQKSLLSNEFYERILEAYNETHRRLFLDGMLQDKNLSTIPVLIDFLKGQTFREKRWAIKNLKLLIGIERKRILKDSIKNMVEPSIGDPRTLPINEEGAEMFKQMKDKETEMILQKNSVPNIRN
ncbi:hypothetical protein [Falsibacillus pallidus]|uniref:Uncharacterized protein n=1 Tax=Falsibacillus pallidus TaxID=493781 RepID=A0A370G256_9BACI|nr:hypothetical protein [Falsibacillus pallidus]RDI37951.1 hypothetical protein DFR59_12049 [Falsibacillus pallidus]